MSRLVVAPVVTIPILQQKVVVIDDVRREKVVVTVGDSAHQLSSINAGLLGGKWYHIARSGVHDDLFANAALITWNLIPRTDRYFSVSVDILRDNTTETLRGNAILSLEGIMDITLSVEGNVISLGQYALQSTDYVYYTFLATPGDLWIWSRDPTINPSEVRTIIAKAEAYGYSGDTIVANTAAVRNTDSFESRVRVNGPSYESTHAPVAITLNTKISLSDVTDDVIAQSQPKTSLYFNRGPSILVKSKSARYTTFRD